MRSKTLTMLALACILFTGCDTLLQTDGFEDEVALCAVSVAVATAEIGVIVFPGKLPIWEEETDKPVATRTVSGIEWVSWSNALASGKPAWFHFTLPGCAPCQWLEDNAFNSLDVIQASQKYACVRMNSVEAMRTWKVFASPSDVFVSKEGNVISRGKSPLTYAFAEYLNRAVQ